MHGQASSPADSTKAAAGQLGFLLALVVLLGLAALIGGPPMHDLNGQFYAIFPHGVLATVFGLAALWVVLAMVMGFRNFLQDVGEKPSLLLSWTHVRQGCRTRSV